jgi:hypothetical protein
VTDVGEKPIIFISLKTMKKKPSPNKTEVKMLTTRVPKILIERVQAFCNENEMTIQDFVSDAIIEKLELVHKERRKKQRL